jgi:hypothetical protein
MEQALWIYNTLSRRKEVFKPLHAPNVGMYVCGPTVYGDPHLGHARPAITFDILFRYLKHLGYKVRYVRNITDVGHLELDADIAHAMMGLNAVKGVEIGAGFASVAHRGTMHGDSMTPQGFRTNNAGGVLGGISTGQDLEVSLAIKPTSSIISPRESIDVHGNPTEVITKGRHDPCVGIRAAPIAEALLALVVMDHALRHRAQCGDVVHAVAPIKASFL